MISIAFQNEFFIGVDKPPLWLSVPSRMGDQDSRKVLGTYLQKEVLKQQIFPVHRLDYEVSGLLLFALSKEAHRDSQSWFESQDIQKFYRAISENPLNKPVSPHEEFLWKSKILRGKRRAYEHPRGKDSLTRAYVLKSQPLIWELEPITGRSHQLRYELSKNEFPIQGDSLYGAQTPFVSGIALRSYKIIFSQNIQSKWKLPPSIELTNPEIFYES